MVSETNGMPNPDKIVVVVLILVLVEDGLRAQISSIEPTPRVVLILVLVEDGLRAYSESTWKLVPGSS